MNIVSTRYGKISGVKMNGHTVFKGIPYAMPPTGQRRWQPPQELSAWDGIYDAVAFKSKAPQRKFASDSFYGKEFYSNEAFKTESDEDCLYLNIWTPAESGQEQLPVAMWIHGGAFMGGYGHEIPFDGESYCQEGVILVTINYRLGVFGFLAHSWLSAESPLGISGNYGIFDQIAALRWVFENISAFGGDPDKITVMGQSAGCRAVQTLISTDLTGDMIRGAVMQSGPLLSAHGMMELTLDDAVEHGEGIVRISGAATLDDLRKMSTAEVLDITSQYLRSLSDGSGMPKLPFSPVIDGYLLKDTYKNLAENGLIKKIPYMVGCNSEDSMLKNLDSSGDDRFALRQWGQNAVNTGIPATYAYYFSRQLPGDDAGAFHSAELWYMFGTIHRCWRPMEAYDEKLSQRMVRYWTQFIKQGNPNASDQTEWLAWDPTTEYIHELN